MDGVNGAGGSVPGTKEGVSNSNRVGEKGFPKKGQAFASFDDEGKGVAQGTNNDIVSVCNGAAVAVSEELFSDQKRSNQDLVGSESCKRGDPKNGSSWALIVGASSDEDENTDSALSDVFPCQSLSEDRSGFPSFGRELIGVVLPPFRADYVYAAVSDRASSDPRAFIVLVLHSLQSPIEGYNGASGSGSDDVDAGHLVPPDSAFARSAMGDWKNHSRLGLVGLGMENPPIPSGSGSGYVKDVLILNIEVQAHASGVDFDTSAEAISTVEGIADANVAGGNFSDADPLSSTENNVQRLPIRLIKGPVDCKPSEVPKECMGSLGSNVGCGIAADSNVGSCGFSSDLHWFGDRPINVYLLISGDKPFCAGDGDANGWSTAGFWVIMFNLIQHGDFGVMSGFGLFENTIGAVGIIHYWIAIGFTHFMLVHSFTKNDHHLSFAQ